MKNKFNLEDKVRYSLHVRGEKKFTGYIRKICVTEYSNSKIANALYYKIRGLHSHMNITEDSIEKLEE